MKIPLGLSGTAFEAGSSSIGSIGCCTPERERERNRQTETRRERETESNRERQTDGGRDRDRTGESQSTRPSRAVIKRDRLRDKEPEKESRPEREGRGVTKHKTPARVSERHRHGGSGV